MEPSEIEPAPFMRERDSFISHWKHSLGLPALFYGSLRAPRIFEIVVGRPMSEVDIETVTLADHELAHVMAGDGYPGIFPTDTPCSLTCILVHGLTREENLRIAWFEWDEYKIGQFTLTDGRVGQAFVPDIETIHRVHGSIDFQPWSYEAWAEEHLTAAIPNAYAWMDLIPNLAPLLTAHPN